MFEIPAASKILNAPNNIVHGKILLGTFPPISSSNAQSGNFVVPDGVYVLWVSLVKSANNTFIPGTAYVFVPMLVTPGEVIPWFIDQTNSGSADTTFGVGARQLSSAGGSSVGVGGMFGVGSGASDGAVLKLTGNILVEW